MIVAALIVLFVAAVWLLAFCLARIAALSDLPHADPGSPPPGSALDAVEFVSPPWTPYEGKRRLP